MLCLAFGGLPCSCAAADFSKNGVGAEGCKQLVQVRLSS